MRNFNKPLAVVASVAALGAVGCGGVNVKHPEVTVCGKERVYDAFNGTSEYRVYTANEEHKSATYRVVDHLILGGTRFTSADFYGALRENVTYDFDTSGYRIGIASQFPNITHATQAAEQHPEWCQQVKIG